MMMTPSDIRSRHQIPDSGREFREIREGDQKVLKNLATLMKRALREKVAVHENGRRRMITKAELISKQLVNKAAAGDLRALSQLSKLEFLVQEFIIPEELDTSQLKSLSFEELSVLVRKYFPNDFKRLDEED